MLHKFDICHGDMDYANTVLSISPFEIYFIDWDFSFNISTCNREKLIDFYELDEDENFEEQVLKLDWESFRESLKLYRILEKRR